MTRSSAAKLLWALLLVLALVAAACGNGGGDTAEPAPTTAEAAPAPTGAAVPEAAPEPEPTEEATPKPTEIPTPAPTEAAGPETAPEPEPTEEATLEPTESEPHPSGLDIDAVEAAVADWMEKARVPGLVLAAAQDNEQPWTFGWGERNLATGEPMTPDDYVRIGSITKSVTTAAVLSLVEEGLLNLDTPVTAYLGDDWYGTYEHGPDITLRHLMGHTAGFVEYAFDPGFFILGAARLGVPIAPDEIVRFTTAYGPVAEFGDDYNYSTAGHVVAGMIIEAVTGNAAHAEIRSRILEPLGVHNTYLTPGELPPEPVTEGYNRGILASAFESLTRVPDEARANFMGSEYIATLSYPQEFLQSAGWTGGGLEAQIGDVPRLFRGLFAGGLLSDASMAEMTTPSVNLGYGLGVGLGDAGGQRFFSHGGGVPGFRSRVAYFPELDLTLAASANLLHPDPDMDELFEDLLPIVMESWGLAS
ncbi:serine hydrolase [Candidatus Poriferisocius sp.]|uniref:serine hydrolase n=1 Tax=Candidatus Poriferisocius sp. TaxID=3101276 RepID=UPI003B027D6D